MTQEIIKANDKTFKKLVLESDKPVMVRFTAEWCGPCKMLSQTINDLLESDLASEDDFRDGVLGSYTLVEVDVEQAVEVCPQYAIRGVPTTAFFSEGNIIGRPRIGGMQTGQLVALVCDTDIILQGIAEEKLEKAKKEAEEEEALKNS